MRKHYNEGKPRKRWRSQVPLTNNKFEIKTIDNDQFTFKYNKGLVKSDFKFGSGTNLLDNINKIDGKREYYALYSGGKDSGTVAKWADEAGVLKACVFVDTTIGVNETKQFVRKTCKDYGWDLIELQPPRSYQEFVLKFGFPKIQGHDMIMRWLKYKPIQLFCRDNKSRKPCMMSGVRVEESKRRFGNVTPFMVDGNLWTCSPIWDWSLFKVLAYSTHRRLSISPAYNKISMSGDCLCGAFGDNVERQMIKGFYPEVDEKIRKIEELVKNVDTIRVENRKVWGNDRVKKYHADLANKDFTEGESMICNDCSTDALKTYTEKKIDPESEIRDKWKIFEERFAKMVLNDEDTPLEELIGDLEQ
jgi:3'-phosphoadenosine 5'-phosphosulfate sulfotransferase (PAPS reductase)/FAD synthetase